MSEFTRPIDLRQPMLAPQRLEATPDECTALATRFDLVAIKRLVADVTLDHQGDGVRAKGRFEADVVQTCAISGEDLKVHIAEPLDLRFVAADRSCPIESEIELELDDLDEIEFEGTSFDLGEAVAQSLALAIDPFLAGPTAEHVRDQAGVLAEGAAGPFAALASLKKPN